MSVTTLHDLTCPACRRRLWGSSSIHGDVAPKAGDGTVCEACGALLLYTATTLRRLEDSDLTHFTSADILTLTTISQHVRAFKPQRRGEDS